MQILRNVKEVKAWRENINKTLGYVPTMGALHDGHASLIKKAKSQNDVVIVTTFINPTQFLHGEDFEKYPKNEEKDCKICEDLGVDAVFIPNSDEIYIQNEPQIEACKNLSTILEGAIRPGHFDGVCKVLNKFFNLIKPQKVYFGKKDTQQIFVVKNMIERFFMDLEIVPCEIVREADGLALSSRNVYLDENEKFLALKLSRSLKKAENLISNGENDIKILKLEMYKILEPLKVDYVEFVDRNFTKIDKFLPNNTIILVAATVGKTRLIDNIWL